MTDELDDLVEEVEILGLDGVTEILEKEIKNLSEKIRTGRIKDQKGRSQD